jgi:hypothetical protein
LETGAWGVNACDSWASSLNFSTPEAGGVSDIGRRCYLIKHPNRRNPRAFDALRCRLARDEGPLCWYSRPPGEHLLRRARQCRVYVASAHQVVITTHHVRDVNDRDSRELLALRWGDADLDRGTVSVVATLEQWRDAVPIVAEPKTSRSLRQVELGDAAVDSLRRLRQHNPGIGFLSPVRMAGH